MINGRDSRLDRCSTCIHQEEGNLNERSCATGRAFHIRRSGFPPRRGPVVQTPRMTVAVLCAYAARLLEIDLPTGWSMPGQGTIESTLNEIFLRLV